MHPMMTLGAMILTAEAGATAISRTSGIEHGQTEIH